MAGCCDPGSYDRQFDDRTARRSARRYRAHGLDKNAQRVVDLATSNGIAGATVLEIGGGVGHIQVELLKRGAARTTNLELSTSYEEQARALLDANGLTDRVDRRVVDIATAPDEVAPADIVVLHRVVCCYPDYERLLAAVADHAGRQVVFSHPPRNFISRFMTAFENLGYRWRGSDFRVFAHPPKDMRAVLARRGLHPTTAQRWSLWQITAAER